MLIKEFTEQILKFPEGIKLQVLIDDNIYHFGSFLNGLFLKEVSLSSKNVYFLGLNMHSFLFEEMKEKRIRNDYVLNYFDFKNFKFIAENFISYLSNYISDLLKDQNCYEIVLKYGGDCYFIPKIEFEINKDKVLIILNKEEKKFNDKMSLYNYLDEKYTFENRSIIYKLTSSNISNNWNTYSNSYLESIISSTSTTGTISATSNSYSDNYSPYYITYNYSPYSWTTEEGDNI